MKKEYAFLPLFKQFVNDNLAGRRLKPNGQRLKKGTVKNYANAYRLLSEFQDHKSFYLRVRAIPASDPKTYKFERNYWKRFYFLFTNYLYEKGCFDNYTGAVVKCIRAFFSYLNIEKQFMTSDVHKQLYVRREEIEILAIRPSRLNFLINNSEFQNSLSLSLKRTKDLLVFGCTVALRYSDLLNIRIRDFETINTDTYLVVRSIKTQHSTRVKLPDYAVAIFQHYSRKKKKPGIPFSETLSAAIQ